MRSEFDDRDPGYEDRQPGYDDRPPGFDDRQPAEDPYWGSERLAEAEPLPGMATFRAWDYRPDAGWAPQFDLIGYHVEASDGSIGKVSQATHAMNGSHLMVDTGPWIFGRTVVIPAGIVTHIDHTDRKVYLDRTKDEVKSSPDYSPEPAYLDKLASHYDGPYRPQ